MVASSLPVRAVLFDMAGTLFPQHQFGQAVAANVAYISGVLGVPAAELSVTLRNCMEAEMRGVWNSPFYLLADIYERAYRRAVEQVGARIAEAQVGEFIEHFRNAAAAAATPQEGAVDTLDMIRAAGLTTGIVSVNDERDLCMLVDACGFGHLFDFVLSSEAARSCKPDGSVFRQALELAGSDPGEAVFIGDMVEMDVRGANRAGMRSVLTTQGLGFFTDFGSVSEDDRPDAVISHLRELPALVLTQG